MNCTCITADCGLQGASSSRVTVHKHFVHPPAALHGRSCTRHSSKLNETSAFAFSMAIPTYTSRPKILIPEKVSPDGLALLKDNFEVDQKQGLSPDELKNIIGDYEALIVRSETKVTGELLSAAKKLKVVARAGVGVDNVDVKTATSLGIIVVNSPSGNINAAAEHTIARKYLPFLQDATEGTLTMVSDDVGCKKCRRRKSKHQSREVGTKSSHWYRSQGKDTCYCWSGER